jgi:hypothetical protein
MRPESLVFDATGLDQMLGGFTKFWTQSLMLVHTLDRRKTKGTIWVSETICDPSESGKVQYSTLNKQLVG